MTDIRVFPVPTNYVPAVWPVVEPMLAKAVATAPGRMDTDDILANIQQGTYLLWLASFDGDVVAALTTRVIEYPKSRALALDWIGGSKLKQILPIGMQAMKNHAAANNCQHLEGYGRAAWLRVIAKHGWKTEYVSYKLEMTDE